MICKRCQASGQRSTVTHSGTQMTCMGYVDYFDEDGRHHDHDPNTFTRCYACSNGHRWIQRWRKQCWCGWDPGEPFGGPRYQEIEDMPSDGEWHSNNSGLVRLRGPV